MSAMQISIVVTFVFTLEAFVLSQASYSQRALRWLFFPVLAVFLFLSGSVAYQYFIGRIQQEAAMADMELWNKESRLLSESLAAEVAALRAKVDFTIETDFPVPIRADLQEFMDENIQMFLLDQLREARLAEPEMQEQLERRERAEGQRLLLLGAYWPPHSTIIMALYLSAGLLHALALKWWSGRGRDGADWAGEAF